MKLIEQYPALLRDEPIFQLIQATFDKEVEISHEELEDLFNQFFITTATWSLSKWEEFAGLEPSESVDIDTRRSNVLAALRSRDTTTKEKVKVVSESYANGECEVIEDNPNYFFYIKFIGVKGVPKRIDELKKSIERIKPAHLGFDFIFTYLIWNEFDRFNKTWDEWDALNLTWDELEVYNGK